jgi:hypothetical protein
MSNDTHVISGHQSLPPVTYTPRGDFLKAVLDTHGTVPDNRKWHRWPRVKNTWSYTLTSLGSGLKTVYTRYHDTDICYAFQDLLYLTPQGFYTRTTMSRLNVVIEGFCALRTYIFQDRSQWWLYARYRDGTQASRVPFEEGLQGVLLDPDLMR